MENQICQNLEKMDALSLPADEEDFRTMRLMPLAADLLSKANATDSELLCPNLISKPYPDVETYLETHIRLLWADFIQPLRETIGLFCQGTAQVPSTDKRNNQQMHFYRNVTFEKDSFLGSPIVPDRPDSWRQYNIRFDTKSGFDWQKSKRLIYGSLVCLWNASRRLIILATVTKSDTQELEKGKLTLSIENPHPKAHDFIDKTYTMLECEIFYEPYRVVMEAYQQLKEDTFPFKELLLGWEKEPGIPTYFRDKTIINNYRIQTSTGTVVKINDVLNINTWPSAIELGVNPIQRIALHAAMTRQVALIQGPPGTGKTFLGRKIISTLLENKHLWHDDGNFEKDNALLVSQFKQKKMDDFWESNGNLWRDKRRPIVVICLTNQALDQFLEGVLKTTTKIIRVGSQSQSALLGLYTITVIKENISQQSKNYKESAFLYYQYGMNGLKKCIKGTVNKIKRRVNKLANHRKDKPRDLRAESRVQQEIYLLEEIYREQIKDYNQLKAKSEEALCRSVDVVGLTTTGAARRRDVLALLQPKIVLVEEAAQVLEPHIIASLTIGCQHLIMIGDHLQLRPQCNVHKMTLNYQMDVSLFERLVKNGVPSVMLAVQHRMRPEVSRLIVPSIYSQLENHPSVHLHPAVPSINRNVFFLDHNHPEAREDNQSSYYNIHEAAMALRLAHFLCEQGIEQEKITVLVTYAAQMRTMLAHRREQFKYRSVDRVHITTVDNYQGEENDIIILSLVRNNKIQSAGFLRTPNRVCVALSRARHGLFILGNIRLLAGSNSKLWVHVREVLTKNGELGNAITLRCDRHQENVVQVSKPEDFPVCRIVCSKKCGTKLECGHSCGMPCRNRCNHVTALCDHKIPINLPCGHSVQVLCSKPKTEDDKLPECKSAICLKKLPCGHPCPLKCGQPCSKAKCNVQVDLNSNSRPCRHLTKVNVNSCLSTLRCGHRCPGQFGKCSSGVHSPCLESCQRKLVCGHPCPVKCGEVCPPCRLAKNAASIDRVLVSAGKNALLEPCKWQCEHGKCDHPCSQLCNRKPCSLSCPRRLSCGHSCPGYCGEICPPQSACPVCLNTNLTDLTVRYVYLWDCFHSVPSTEIVERKSVNGQFKIPMCPRCSQMIRLTYGRYADQVKTFYEDLRFARFLYDQDGRQLQNAIINLLDVEDMAKENVSTAVESMIKDVFFEEQWQIYQRMYYVCLLTDFKRLVYDIYPFTTVDCTSGKVTLMETWAKDLLTRHQSVQNSLLETIRGFLSVDCLADSLTQWRRLDLLRQCQTMESVQPMSLKSTLCHSFLREAKVLLEKETTNWTSDQENVVLGLLQFVANSMKFHFIHPDSQIKPSLFHPVGMNADNWIKCAYCKSVYPSNCFDSCPKIDRS